MAEESEEMSDRTRFVYVMARGDGCHKIGVSADPDDRCRQLCGSAAQEVEVVALWPRDQTEAFKIESCAHQALWQRAVGGEWFAISAREACDAVLDSIDRFDRTFRRDLVPDVYVEECAKWGKDAVDESLAKVNAEWDSYWLARGSVHCGLDLWPEDEPVTG